MEIDLVMCCYNIKKFVVEAVESVLKQTDDRWKLYIVDDCSTIDCIETLNKALLESGISTNKVSISRNSKNMGYGYTLRKGISLGKSSIFGIIDGDDTLHETAVEIMLRSHEKYKNASLIYSNYWECDNKLRNKTECPYCRSLADGETYLERKSKIRISHFKTYKRELYNRTDGVDSTLLKSVDKDLTLKMEEVGDLIYIPKKLYYYRKHGGQLTGLPGIDSGMKKQIRERSRKIWEDAKKRRGIA